MAIEAISGTTTRNNVHRLLQKQDNGAQDSFSAMLTQMRKGGSPADEHSGSDKTTTVTQVLSDGSVMTTVYEDGKIVSQSKTHAAHPQKNPHILSTHIEKNAPDGQNMLNQQNTTADLSQQLIGFGGIGMSMAALLQN